MGARIVLRPDLFCRIGSGAYEDRWFIEIDMATEARSTLAGKARRYLSHYRSGFEQRQHGVYPRIVWAAPDARRTDVIEDALRSLPSEAQRLFVVVTQAELVDYLKHEARS
jgi:Replication-relaxation